MPEIIKLPQHISKTLDETKKIQKKKSLKIIQRFISNRFEFNF